MNTPTPDQTELMETLTDFLEDSLAALEEDDIKRRITASDEALEEALAAISKLMLEQRIDELERAALVREFTHHPYIKDRLAELKKGI